MSPARCMRARWSRLAASTTSSDSASAACLLLLVLRGFNIYGETLPWVHGETFVKTLMSWLNFTKYPPSLDFLLLTLGIAFLLMAWFETMDNAATRTLMLFGAAPMFFYIFHLYVLLVLYRIALAIFGPNQGELFGVDDFYWVWIVAAAAGVRALFPNSRVRTLQAHFEAGVGAVFLMIRRMQAGRPALRAETHAGGAVVAPRGRTGSFTIAWDAAGSFAMKKMARCSALRRGGPTAKPLGSVGLVVVDRQQQGKGIGRRLMNLIIDEAGSRALQLVATKAGLKLYQQCGFREVGGIEQRQGVAAPQSSAPAPSGVTLRAVMPSDLAALAIWTQQLSAPRGTR